MFGSYKSSVTHAKQICSIYWEWETINFVTIQCLSETSKIFWSDDCHFFKNIYYYFFGEIYLYDSGHVFVTKLLAALLIY